MILICYSCLAAIPPSPQDSQIPHSVIGLRSLIGKGSVVKDSLLMGADYYEVGERGVEVEGE